MIFSPSENTFGTKIFFILATAILFFSTPAYAYPEFVSYGYKSCVTCHYSGTGGGALSDYGRALFATEIAAKTFFSPSVDDEKLGECSRFFGCISNPYWLKIGAKYRHLIQKSKLGSSESETRNIPMQADVNLASFTSEEETFGLIATLSYAPDQRYASPNRPIGSSEMMAREYFFRYKGSETTWWYLGFFDKAYGLKHPDHTAFNRAQIKVGMNDQVHGVMFHQTTENNEVFVHPYVGNLHLSPWQQTKGLSVLYENSITDISTLGATARYETSDLETLSALGLITRLGIEGGHAILFELGLKNRKLSASDAELGFYDFLELHLKLARGLNFQSILQMEQSALKNESPMNLSWGFGFLYFPMQRVELRAQAIQLRQQSNTNVSEDEWRGQLQLHLSL